MKAIYKLALLVAVVLCILIIIYYAGQKNSNTPGNSSLADADHYSQTSGDSHKSFAQRLSEQLNGGGDKHKINADADNKGFNTADLSKSFSQQGGNQVPANENNPNKTGNSLTSGMNQQNVFGEDSSPALADAYQTAGSPGNSDTPAGAGSNVAPPSHSAPASDSDTKPKPETAKPKPSYYIVKPGDTLISISREVYGDGSEWRNLIQANPDVNPKKLYVGQKLSTPPLPGPGHPSTDSNKSNSKSTDAKGNKSYVVQKGDSLSSIARQFYNDTDQWKKIYKANRDKIGDDPSYLQAGMKLVIPE